MTQTYLMHYSLADHRHLPIQPYVMPLEWTANIVNWQRMHRTLILSRMTALAMLMIMLQLARHNITRWARDDNDVEFGWQHPIIFARLVWVSEEHELLFACSLTLSLLLLWTTHNICICNFSRSLHARNDLCARAHIFTQFPLANKKTKTLRSTSILYCAYWK